MGASAAGGKRSEAGAALSGHTLIWLDNSRPKATGIVLRLCWIGTPESEGQQQGQAQGGCAVRHPSYICAVLCSLEETAVRLQRLLAPSAAGWRLALVGRAMLRCAIPPGVMRRLTW